ncbi:tumor necrosis factor superfamily, member 5-induced protein 1, isoform CRA_a [Mus musculus]|uniref:Isoform 2 of Proteasome assembly chaperone 2 n=1 Tax=Mus musculus TaxID=10090 RepID=Q9EST4-2|nr:tumor necrosis factor superfamily, member 5-induced protein 1, isoform CRA_a [Mus musculus]BAE22586.1 unnamed protein product [Mus musculus]
MFVPCGESVPDLTNFTLLMPAVSVGNVGQLAIDLIISTLNMCKIGYFYTDCLVPMVGNNPYATEEENSNELSINTEVYSLPSKKLVVLQLRSIFIKVSMLAFLSSLMYGDRTQSLALRIKTNFIILFYILRKGLDLIKNFIIFQVCYYHFIFILKEIVDYS